MSISIQKSNSLYKHSTYFKRANRKYTSYNRLNPDSVRESLKRTINYLDTNLCTDHFIRRTKQK